MPRTDSLPAPVAMPIQPKDDAYHALQGLGDVEWWYFDTVLDNGDSIHVGVRTFHIRNSGIARARITFYRQNILDVEAIKTSVFPDVLLSKQDPNVVLNGSQVFRFDTDHFRNTGEWRYLVSLQIRETKVDLVFQIDEGKRVCDRLPPPPRGEGGRAADILPGVLQVAPKIAAAESF